MTDPPELNCPLIEGHVPNRVNPIVPILDAGSIRDFEHHRVLGPVSWVVEAGLSSVAYLYWLVMQSLRSRTSRMESSPGRIVEEEEIGESLLGEGVGDH